MNVKKITRVPKRVKDDLSIILTTLNWSEILSAKLKGSDVRRLLFRNGLILESPEQICLNMLFHEIWVEKIYTPEGYEIKENDVVLDIGANIGVFSIYAATRANNVKVFAYEPFSSNFEWLQKNIKINKLDLVEIFEKAVAGESGQRTLEVANAWVGHSLKEKNSDDGVQIESISLDEAIKPLENCNFMKIDCEGSEYEILYSSSKETLMKIEKVVGEYHNLNQSDMNGSALCSFLNQNGFKITHYSYFGDNTGSFCATKL